MKKATTKNLSRTRKSGTKSIKQQDSSLQARLESEFAAAVQSAHSYINDPERLRALVKEAARKVASLPRKPFQETWAYLQAMLRLIGAFSRGDYRKVPATKMLMIIAAIIYIVNPFDFIPDWVPALGFLDDAFVLAFALRRTQQALDDFMIWETTAL